jgi:hypothetical protein
MASMLCTLEAQLNGTVNSSSAFDAGGYLDYEYTRGND